MAIELQRFYWLISHNFQLDLVFAEKVCAVIPHKGRSYFDPIIIMAGLLAKCVIGLLLKWTASGVRFPKD